jgi:uncharacterized protein (TIGR04255 family)
MMEQAIIDEVFPNHPLREVAFEIRFPMNLRILPEIYRFQEELGSEYTLYGREESVAPNSLIVVNFVFHNQNTGLQVKVWEDKLAIITSKYENFEAFSKEVATRSQSFCLLYKIERLDRIGLRYVNNLMLPEGDDIRTLVKYVKPYFNLPPSDAVQPLQFRTETLAQRKNCSIGIRSGYIPASQNNIYLLDLDAFVDSQQSPKNLLPVLHNLHDQVQIEFLSHITDSYIEIMRRTK